MSRNAKKESDFLNDFANKVVEQWLIRENVGPADIKLYCDEAEKFDELVVSVDASQIKNSFFKLIAEIATLKGLNGGDVSWKIQKEFNTLFQEEHYLSDGVNAVSQRVVLVGIPLFGSFNKLADIANLAFLFRKSGMAPQKSNTQFLGLLDSLSTIRLAQDFETISKFKEEYTQLPKPFYNTLNDYVSASTSSSISESQAPYVATFAINAHFSDEDCGSIFAFDGDNFDGEEYEKIVSEWEKELKAFLADKDPDFQELLTDCAPFPLLDAGVFSLRTAVSQSFYTIYWNGVADEDVSTARIFKEMLFLDEKNNENAFVVFFDDEDYTTIEFGVSDLPACVVRELGELAHSTVYKFEQKDQKVMELMSQLQTSVSSTPSKAPKKLH